MKKQILAKSALMAVAVMGVFSLNSCKEENEIVDLGKEVKATIGVTMANRPGSSLKATAVTGDELNMGTTMQPIQNIVIVPFVGSNAGNNIVYGTYTLGTDENKYVTVTIPQATNMFRVYGNLPGSFSASNVFAMPDLTLNNASFDAKDAALTDVYPAHKLYYYAEAKGTTEAETTGFKVGNGVAAGDWKGTATAAPTDGTVGDHDRVAITTPLRYAVGALAAAVLDGVEGENLTKQCFFNPASGSETKSWNDLKAAGGITIEGIIIEGQSKSFDATFTPSTDEVKVYAAAATTVLSADKVSNADGKVSDANIYSVVAPEDAQSITVNFQFLNNTGYSLRMNDETPDNDDDNPVIATGEYFYLATSLTKEPDQNIFDAFTSTVLNATVTDWGKASETPVETTDVELGITVDMDWETGIVYDVEL